MRTLFASLLSAIIMAVVAMPVQAQLDPSPVATESTTVIATASAEPATAAATLIERIQDQQNKDITSPITQKDFLATTLEANPITKVSWYNSFQYIVRTAIAKGLPANIVVLLLLFPVIASFIAFSRHIIGLKGFGIYTPAVLSVAFVSTGIVTGILLFIIVLGAALFMKRIIKRLNLQYLPRTALLLWGVSLFAVLTLVGFALLPFSVIVPVSIFPLLIIMLLTENFMESQLAGNQSEALQLTLETLVTAVLCSFIIGSKSVQTWVILQPELTLIIVALFNILIGRYVGLRLLEWVRFRTIID